MATKNNKNRYSITKKDDNDSNFYISIFILLIMIMSIAGFAMMGSSSGGQRTQNGVVQNLPLQMQEQDGQTFWIAIRDYKPFVFSNIDGYDQDIVSLGIANKLKSKSQVNIYIDKGYESQDAVFLIERALSGLKIMTTEIRDYNCDENSIVFTYNQSIKGDCIIINSQKEEAYKQAEIIVYHLVK